MKKIITICFCLVGIYANSQSLERSVIGTSGNYFYVGGTGSLSFTEGESAVVTLSSASNILTQGFQQPDTSGITFVLENDVPVDVNIFPNPVNDFLSCIISKENANRFRFSVYDETGKLISIPVITNGDNFLFDVSKLTAGNYLFTVVDTKSKVSVSRKFIKL